MDGRTDGWMNACAEGWVLNCIKNFWWCLLQMPRTVSLSQGPTCSCIFNVHLAMELLCSLSSLVFLVVSKGLTKVLIQLPEDSI